MSLLTFNFCGVDAVNDLGFIVNSIKRPVTPEITENTQDVPGMVGKIFLGNSYGQKVFQIDITIMAVTSEDLVQKINDLTELVMTFGSGEYPMVFSDDAAYTYYGHFNAISTPERIGSCATCTLTFACSDPKGYGEYQQRNMLNNPVTITPDGTTECYPIFTCIPTKDMTRIAITDQDENYVYIGADVDPDTGESPIDKEPLVLNDTCGTMATWTPITQGTLTFTPENGVIGGAMRSANDALKIALDGSGQPNFGSPIAGKWHGPISQQWLTGQYSDYRVRIWLYNNQYYHRAKGKVELYLLNNVGKAIGKITIKDNSISSKAIIQVTVFGSSKSYNIVYDQGTIQKKKATTKTIKVRNGVKKVTSKGKTKTEQQWKTVTLPDDPSTDTYTNFYGYIELQKIGNKFRVEIMKCNDKHNPVWDKPVTKTFTDNSNIYTQQLAGVAVYIAKYDIEEDTAVPVVKYSNNGLALSDIQIWNIIDGGNNSVSSPTVIARKGDEIKINCEDRTVYKNGAVYMENFYIGSQFITMQGGVPKSFAFSPDLKDAEWFYEYRPTTQ